VAVKLIMTWDIQPGREQDYFEFVVREYLPALEQMGLEPSDAWFTMYGNQPQVMATAQSKTLQAMQRALKSSAWDSLIRRLSDYVDNFEYKIVEARPGFQL